MQKETLESRVCKRPIVFRRTVAAVSEDGVPLFRRVAADLMHASGLETQLKEGGL